MDILGCRYFITRYLRLYISKIYFVLLNLNNSRGELYSNDTLQNSIFLQTLDLFDYY